MLEVPEAALVIGAVGIAAVLVPGSPFAADDAPAEEDRMASLQDRIRNARASNALTFREVEPGASNSDDAQVRRQKSAD